MVDGMPPRRKRLTEAKVQRAIAALVEILECEDVDRSILRTTAVDDVCGQLRKLPVSR